MLKALRFEILNSELLRTSTAVAVVPEVPEVPHRPHYISPGFPAPNIC